MLNSISRNHRPYFSYKYEQLFEVAKNNWDDVNALQELNGELSHRNKSWTIDLRNQVNEQLEKLENDERLIRLKGKRKLKNRESFPWVSTGVYFGSDKIDTSDWRKNNVLSLLGYKSGNYSNLDDKDRRDILDAAYTKSIPKEILASEGIEDWGEENFGIRLKMIANSIALIVRSEKMHKYDYSLSIAQRESDLAYLKKKYYDGFYDK